MNSKTKVNNITKLIFCHEEFIKLKVLNYGINS